MATQKLPAMFTTAITASHHTRSLASQATTPSRVEATAWSGTSHSLRQTASSRISPAAIPSPTVTSPGRPPSSEPRNALASSAQADQGGGRGVPAIALAAQGQGSEWLARATRSVT